MKFSIRLKVLFFIGLSLCTHQKSFSQCFQIESILVDACDTGADEGFNEMVRFKVGSAAINANALTVTWPSNTWLGLIQNATTASKVAALNAQISSAGGCGQIIEPTAGVLPANAKVILVTSFNFSVALNTFGAITQNIYIIFQDNPTTTGGHFGNYSATPGLRTLSMSFGACSDTVSYERSLLVNTNGTSGGSSAINNGSTVNYTPSGTASYINNGCVAPVEVFTVDAGPSPVSACAGSVISLTGTAVGQQSVTWSAASGSFSTPNSLNTNYTLSPSATGTVVLTLTATNTCGTTKTSTVTVNINAPVTPNFATTLSLCSGSTAPALAASSPNGISGVWTPSTINNTTSGTYTFVPNAGQCAVNATLSVTILSSIVPNFATTLSLCSGSAAPALASSSPNGISGAWSPSTINNTTSGTYTFTPNAGQCAVNTSLAVTITTGIVPNFATTLSLCSGSTAPALATSSPNGISGVWTPLTINNTTSGTYTFVPNSMQCAVNATLSVTIATSIVPDFATTLSLCSGSVAPALEASSPNGISGTWTPATINNTSNGTYTFTPNAGQCAVNTTLTVTTTTSTVPNFATTLSLCSGSVAPALATSSPNGITGMWSPSTINNTTSANYTFMPDAGQCASSVVTAVLIQNGINFEITAGCIDNNFILQAAALANSFDVGSANFNWQNSIGVTVGTNNSAFDVTGYLNATPENETFPLTFSVIVTSAEGCTKTNFITIAGIYCGIQKGISPNNDGKNEFFDLTLLNVSQLSIFNRYGTKVYSLPDYTNQWHGQTDSGKDLPDATYYYVIEFKNNQASKTGWIYINK